MGKAKQQDSLRRLGVILFLGGALVCFEVARRYLHFENSSAAERLQILWNKDVQSLELAHKVPPGWADLKEVKVVAATDRARDLMKTVQSPLKVHASGKFKMEVLLLTWEEGSSEGVIVQYNLVDLKSQNMIWELGRTFILKGDRIPIDQ